MQKVAKNAKIYQKIYCKICAKNNAKLPEKECENSSKKNKNYAFIGQNSKV